MDIQPYRPGNAALGFLAWLGQQGIGRQAFGHLNRYAQARLREEYRAYRARVAARREFDDRAEGYNKRQKSSTDTSAEVQDQPMASSGADGNANQYAWARDKVAVKAPKKYRLTPKSLWNLTYRWQSLSDFKSTPANHRLGCYTIAASNLTVLPMYAFDLSSLPQGVMTIPTGASSSNVSFPFYRLTANKSSTSVDDSVYNWIVQQGINNAPSGSGNWARSHLEDTDAPIGSNPPYASKYRHNYSDIRLVMNGAKTRPTKVHVKIVRFKDDDFAPRRYYQFWQTADGAGSIWDDAVTDGEKNRQIGGFWDRFWAHRETNPLRSVRNEVATPLYDVVYHRSFNFSPTNSTDNDINADQKVFKLFFRDGHSHNTDSGIKDAIQDTTVMNAATNAQFGYKAVSATPGLNDDDSYGIFPKNRYVYWLLVYGDTYLKEAETATTDNNASFDLMVRGNFTVPATNRFGSVGP